MAMTLVKKTDEYSIFKRKDGRYAIQDAAKNAVNGDEKAKILAAEGLVTLSVPAPVEEAPAETTEEAPAEESEDS